MGLRKSLAAVCLLSSRDRPLPVVGKEDRRAVLRAHVVALPVRRGGIVHLPELFEDLFKRHFLGVENDPGDLRVAGVALANLLVGRVDGRASHVAAGDAQHAGNLLENGLGAPEATGGEVDDFRPGRGGGHGGGGFGLVRGIHGWWESTPGRDVRQVGERSGDRPHKWKNRLAVTLNVGLFVGSRHKKTVVLAPGKWYF